MSLTSVEKTYIAQIVLLATPSDLKGLKTDSEEELLLYNRLSGQRLLSSQERKAMELAIECRVRIEAREKGKTGNWYLFKRRMQLANAVTRGNNLYKQFLAALLLTMLFSNPATAGIFDKTRTECFNSCIEDKLPKANDALQTKMYLKLCTEDCRRYERCFVQRLETGKKDLTRYQVSPEHSSFNSFLMEGPQLEPQYLNDLLGTAEERIERETKLNLKCEWK